MAFHVVQHVTLVDELVTLIEAVRAELLAATEFEPSGIGRVRPAKIFSIAAHHRLTNGNH